MPMFRHRRWVNKKVINPGLERVETTQIQFAKRVSTMYEDWMLNRFERNWKCIVAFLPEIRIVEASFNVTLLEYWLRVIYVRADTGAKKNIRAPYELDPTAWWIREKLYRSLLRKSLSSLNSLMRLSLIGFAPYRIDLKWRFNHFLSAWPMAETPRWFWYICCRSIGILHKIIKWHKHA
jgi:hypothetical protein